MATKKRQVRSVTASLHGLALSAVCGQQTSSAPNKLCVQAEQSRIVIHLSLRLSAPFVCLAQSPCEFRRAAIDGALDGGV